MECDNHTIKVGAQEVLAKLCHFYTSHNIICPTGNDISNNKHLNKSYSDYKDMINDRNILKSSEQNKRKSIPCTEDSSVNKRTKVFEVSEMLNQSPILKSVKEFENNRKGSK